MTPEFHTPMGIEGESMRIIAAELADMGLTPPPDRAAVVLRAIHTSADFDYAKNLRFTPGAVEAGVAALKAGAPILTDTNMALAGVNRPACGRLGVTPLCYMADPQVAQAAKAADCTRAVCAVDRWVEEHPGAVCAVGNAPTALLRLVEHLEGGTFRPALIIGVPVGFVNVVESKQLLWDTCQKLGVPAIVAMGRKGGSNVAAAICNALLYQAAGRE